MKLKFYTDPGHGWLAVKRNLLYKYGIADKISSFSYQRGATVYLEEDSDAGKLLDALKAAGVEIEFDEKNTDRSHPIRSYDRYSYVGAVAGHMVDKRLRWEFPTVKAAEDYIANTVMKIDHDGVVAGDYYIDDMTVTG